MPSQVGRYDLRRAGERSWRSGNSDDWRCCVGRRCDSHIHKLSHSTFPSIASSPSSIHHIPSLIMSDGRLKADRDFTKEVDKAIPEAQDLAKVARSCVRNTKHSC
jgi:hypothetical protein